MCRGRSHQLLHVNIGAPEGPFRLARGIAKGRLQFVRAVHAAHALAAAPGHRFQQDGIPVALAEGPHFLEGRRMIQPGHHRRAARDGGLSRRRLRPHHADGFRRRADEYQPGLLACRRELGVLAEKAVPRMDRLGAMLPRGIQNAIHAQVALRRRRGPDVLGFVRHAHVERRTVGIGKYRYGRNPHLPQRSNYPHRDLPAVGNQHLSEHAPEL